LKSTPENRFTAFEAVVVLARKLSPFVTGGLLSFGRFDCGFATVLVAPEVDLVRSNDEDRGGIGALPLLALYFSVLSGLENGNERLVEVL
jgi:hypothetical protein